VLFPPVTAASKAFSPRTVLPATEFAPLPIFTELNTPSTLKVALPFESIVTLEPELVAKAKVLVADRNTPLAGALL
jgi:hypothetical protein